MSKCNRCNIKVKDDSLICPLCKGALSETEHVQPVYPDMFPKQQRMRLAIRIVTFCVVVGRAWYRELYDLSWRPLVTGKPCRNCVSVLYIYVYCTAIGR